jgi:hypothetical protein
MNQHRQVPLVKSWSKCGNELFVRDWERKKISTVKNENERANALETVGSLFPGMPNWKNLRRRKE